jgi:hypothetical protein
MSDATVPKFSRSAMVAECQANRDKARELSIITALDGEHIRVNAIQWGALSDDDKRTLAESCCVCLGDKNAVFINDHTGDTITVAHGFRIPFTAPAETASGGPRA